MGKSDPWNIHAIISFILLALGVTIFAFGFIYSEPDSQSSWGLVILGILSLPISFLWAVYALFVNKNKKGKVLIIITLIFSGVVSLISIIKLY